MSAFLHEAQGFNDGECLLLLELQVWDQEGKKPAQRVGGER